MALTSRKISNANGQIIEGPLLIKPNVFKDERGFFMESWNSNDWKSIIEKSKQEFNLFLQDNHSKSVKGTLRGLHYQKEPYAQGKLVRCLRGEIYDVAVDLRKSSKTFMSYAFVNLSSHNQTQFWIPKGFAHGFLTLTEDTEVLYKTTNYWNKDSELTLKWDDPSININWPLSTLKQEVNISEKDRNAFSLDQLKNEYLFL